MQVRYQLRQRPVRVDRLAPVTASSPLFGVVLCGGRSRRMGTDKALLDWGGAPLLVHVARRLAVVAAPVVAASGEVGRLAEAAAAAHVTEVADEPGIDGPLAGLLAGLAAAPHELVAVVAVDMPDVAPALLGELARRLHARPDVDVAVPETADGLQPLHAVYRATRAVPRLRTAADGGVRSLRRALGHLTLDVVGPTGWAPFDPSAAFASNLNTPEDVAEHAT